MNAWFKLYLLGFLLIICLFHRNLREGFTAAVNSMNLTLSQMVSNLGLQIPDQTLPYNAICAKVATGKGQCKPPYQCQTNSPLQYGNCL
jgi:hypothetical protein